ncbi:hypothetical protein WJX72_002831 [[Myrmecia] bisecta]|uniref:Pyridoxamine 5'-phosphate oxidase Alr4036 family FMN-binding domain-containing protein n=1 Tax=[Myrmecia] bisecta TaxID=41462 RepID=A0AAW1QPU3_9CHLO
MLGRQPAGLSDHHLDHKSHSATPIGNPCQQPLPSPMLAWRQALTKSLDANSKVPFSKFFQLATIRHDGRPTNRTMVFRGFYKDTDRLTFTTDIRSKKYDDLRTHSKAAEICWYFTESREQFRLNGDLTVIDKDEEDPELVQARKQAWSEMSTSGRSWFTWPKPGLPRGPDEQFQIEPPGPEEPPLPSFCLVIMDVMEVDHLELRSSIRHSYSSQLDSDGERLWHEEDVNP